MTVTNINRFDLSKAGALSIDDAKRIDELEPEVRQKYNRYMAQLVKCNQLCRLSMLLSVTCRNTIQSELLDHLCRMALLEDKLKAGVNIDTVIVDSPFLVDPVKAMLVNYGIRNSVVDCKIKRPSLLKKIIINILKTVYGTLSDLFWSRRYESKKQPEGPILLVDTFLFSNSFDAGEPFVDRFYVGHEAFLSEAEKQQCWYAPTLIGIRKPADYKKLFVGLKRTGANFLIQESWTGLTDYLYAIAVSARLPFKINDIPYCEGIDLSGLIRFEARRDIFAFSLVKAICKYRFIGLLSKKNVVIEGAIDWHENQVIDRALNLGLKNYYPDVTVHGYQGYMVPEHYACTQPQQFERELNTLPDVFHVIGQKVKETREQAFNGIQVAVSPAFRFSYLFDIDRKPNDKKQILVALPIMIDESRKLVEASMALLDETEYPLQIILKQHPSYTVERFVELIPLARDPRLLITDQTMPALLQQITLMISSTSSSCLEAIALGVPVAVLGSCSGVTMNPIPNSIDQSLWCIFYSTEQLKRFIDTALVSQTHHSMVDELFHPVDELHTKALFTCPQQG